MIDTMNDITKEDWEIIEKEILKRIKKQLFDVRATTLNITDPVSRLVEAAKIAHYVVQDLCWEQERRGEREAERIC